MNAEKIAIIKRKLLDDGIEPFINARIDTYYLQVLCGVETPNLLDETLRRIDLYENAGADGFFIPLASDDLTTIVDATQLPITVVTNPENAESYIGSGVKRILLSNDVYVQAENSIESRLSNCIR